MNDCKSSRPLSIETLAPSYRGVYDTGDWDAAMIVSTTGQSEHPLDGHFADLIDPWNAGKLLPFPFSDSAVAKTATDMLRTSEQYAAIEVADDPLWGDFSDTARSHVRALKVLRGTQTHPVLLAALARWEPEEVQRLLRLLEVVIVRYQLIGGGRTGILEIGCATVAAAIYAGTARRVAPSPST